MDAAHILDFLESSHDPGHKQAWIVRCPRSCDSTNHLARQVLALHPDARILVAADHQTAGRGRLGRIWQSEPGQNLLFSVVLRPPVPAVQAARCVLVWAAALARELDAWLKWPNDLVDEQDRKLGGLLAVLDGTAPVRVVLGVGVNVNQVTFAGLPGATSLAARDGLPHDRQALLVRLVQALESADVVAPAALDAWRERNRTLGRRVRVGATEGNAQALREDGALMIDGAPVLAGDVELIGG